MTEPQLDFDFEAQNRPGAPAPVTSAPVPTPVAAVATVAGGLPSDAAQMANLLDQHPDYRVLRRLVPRLQFDNVPQGPLVHVVVLDTETTGLDATLERIIELAMLRVAVDTTTGLPCGPVMVFDGLEDPGKPISDEIVKLTGITNDMVRGQRLDEAGIARMLEGVSLVLAHNAGFDRPFVEARLPQFAELDWACSFADIDWKQEGLGSAKLEFLAQSQGWFYDAHRADMDCHALLAVLCTQWPVMQRTGLAQLIHASGQTAYRLEATNSPFSSKDALKARAYRWNPNEKVWYTQLSDEAALDAECAWLKEAVYGGRSAKVKIEILDAKHRFSKRAGLSDSRSV